MKNTVTIKSVAQKAGVAVSTVSRVINNQDRVNPKTRERILRVIEETGYVRNDIAASIKTGSTKFIVVVVPDIINEFYTEVVQGVEKKARKYGYYTIVYSASNEGRTRVNIFNEKFGHIVDGVIFVPSMENDHIRYNLQKPFVTIDRELSENDGYSITTDNYRGACIMTQELIDWGHRKIAFLYGDSPFTVATERERGFRETMIKNGLPITEAYICKGSWQSESGYESARELLQLPDPPTAIFAANNQICLGCAQYILENGLHIGEDISLVEFDDSRIAPYLGPGITSISHPTVEMGEIGAEMLISLLHKQPEKIEKKKVVLGVQLIQRNSIARLR